MGLYKQYFRVGRYATNHIFGVDNGAVPVQMLISRGGKIDTGE